MESTNALLVLNFNIKKLKKISMQFKNGNESELKEAWTLFNQALLEEPKNTMKWLLFIRDIKSGLGERELFRMFLVLLAKNNIELAMKLFQLNLSEFGRFDDELSIYDKVNSGIQGIILKKTSQQLEEDRLLMEEDKPISLLAKWMPSINTSSKRTCFLANMLAKDLHLTQRQYRKILAELRRYLNVLERNLTNKNYQNIDYSKVPFCASRKYADVFYIRDEERRRNYIFNKLSEDNIILPSEPGISPVDEFVPKEQRLVGKHDSNPYNRLVGLLNNDRYNCINDIFQ